MPEEAGHPGDDGANRDSETKEIAFSSLVTMWPRNTTERTAMAKGLRQ
jgi:hypothetical protein